MNKAKQNTFYFFSMMIFIVIIVFIYSSKRTGTAGCNTIDSHQAINIVKNLPEVKTYLEKGTIKTKNQISKATIDIDSETATVYTVHVYSNEQYSNDPEMGHAATMNWYAVDKCAGKIKCSFAEYDTSGRYVKNNDDYPCE